MRIKKNTNKFNYLALSLSKSFPRKSSSFPNIGLVLEKTKCIRVMINIPGVIVQPKQECFVSCSIRISNTSNIYGKLSDVSIRWLVSDIKLKTDPPSPFNNNNNNKKKREKEEERNDITKFIHQLPNCTTLIQTVAILAEGITKHKPMLRVGLCSNTLTQCGRNRHQGYIKTLYDLHSCVGLSSAMIQSFNVSVHPVEMKRKPPKTVCGCPCDG